MPSFEHHGARIYYEEFGHGFPILTFAPAGLQSTIAVWSEPSAPINPMTEFADKFRVIAMDQRNAGGQSRAPINAQDGWDSYTSDHIALLDQLRIDRCHLYGQCIGGSLIMNMLKHHPERVQSAVMAQPIGRVGPMAPGRPARFDGWAETLKDHPEATPQVLDVEAAAAGLAFMRRLVELAEQGSDSLVFEGDGVEARVLRAGGPIKETATRVGNLLATPQARVGPSRARGDHGRGRD